jgi:hypothetical protein
VLDVKILKLMFKEEFRLQASFFNRSYFLFSALARLGAAALVIAAPLGLYLWFTGIDIKEAVSLFPALVFYHFHSFYLVLGILIISLVFSAISSFFIKEVPTPHERKAKDVFMRTVRLTFLYSVTWFIESVMLWDISKERWTCC